MRSGIFACLFFLVSSTAAQNVNADEWGFPSSLEGGWMLTRVLGGEGCAEDLRVRLDVPVGPSEMQSLFINRVAKDGSEQAALSFVDLNGDVRERTRGEDKGIERRFSSIERKAAMVFLIDQREFCSYLDDDCDPWHTDEVYRNFAIFLDSESPCLLIRSRCEGFGNQTISCSQICTYEKAVD